jgi:hypothetical protein
MDELSTEKKREIVKLVFPDLRFGGDPDIERYFELRKAGRLGHALSVYNGALRVRYPDDTARVLLLKLFRENDPRYAAYQESLVLDFAARLSARIRFNIDLIIAPLERADLSDALHALKAVESVLSRIPGETDGALDLLIRYDQFARILGHREVLVKRALDLIREYDAVSRADAPSEYDFIARSAAIEAQRRVSSQRSDAYSPTGPAEESYDFVSRSASLERRRQKSGTRSHNYFDPDRIKFTEADKARVEISPSLTRREDKVLAICAKYWPHVKDASFERIVFLFSRKFGGKHFEVFRAIKLERAHGATDDEILSSVAAILTTSYSYSVSGDLYMQIMWRRLRARLDDRVVAERLAMPGPEATTRAGPVPESRVRTRRASIPSSAKDLSEARPVPPLPAKNGPPADDELPTRVAQYSSSKGRITAPPSFVLRATSLRAQTDQAPRDKGLGLRAASRVTAPPERRIAAPSSAHNGVTSKAVGVSAGSAMLRPATKGGRLLGRVRAGPEPVREIRAKRDSISDSIRKLSGRTYDVYKEIFLAKVRDHIHRTLLASQTRSHGIFGTETNDAEDQVYGFITAHYDDPFMDWEHSAEHDAVEALGFSMPSLLPIIESCFKKL